MPKRSNPFSEDVLQQSKIHVGVKEVDQGVNKDQNMKAVYERTHKLLFGVSELGNSSASRNVHACQNILNGSLRSDLRDNCRKCSVISGVYKCSFCETRICGECCRRCTRCEEDFCHLCSVMQYHMSREVAVCLSCL